MMSPFEKTGSFWELKSRLLLALILAAFATAQAAPRTATNAPPQKGPMDSNKTPAVNANGRLGEMITVPAGSLLMGNNGHEGFGGPEESPQHRVDLPTYQIGKYEVTRGQYRRFMGAGGYEDPRYWSPEGWKWKESNDLVYAGMYGKFNRVSRPDNAGKRREPEHWAAEQEWIGHGHDHPRFTQTDHHPWSA